jgi:hypothetical protein
LKESVIKQEGLPDEVLESFVEVEAALDSIEAALDEALCGAGSIRRDMGIDDPRCDECVCQG